MKPILLINDDQALLDQISGVLEDGNFKFYAVKTAKEALYFANLYDFSLVLIDLKLPDMDGDELYARLLKSESHYTLPIVTFVDGLDAGEVEVLNRLVPQASVTLLSKPPKNEWLTELFERHAGK